MPRVPDGLGGWRELDRPFTLDVTEIETLYHYFEHAYVDPNTRPILYALVGRLSAWMRERGGVTV